MGISATGSFGQKRVRGSDHVDCFGYFPVPQEYLPCCLEDPQEPSESFRIHHSPPVSPPWCYGVPVSLKLSRKWTITVEVSSSPTFRSSSPHPYQNTKSNVCPVWGVGPEIIWNRPVVVMVAAKSWTTPPSEIFVIYLTEFFFYRCVIW